MNITRPEKIVGNISLNEDGCWIWKGYINKHGYSNMHRKSYQVFIGDIPPRHDIDHVCRNRACVNPDHLEAVTRLEKVLRSTVGLRKKARTHCTHGHEYSSKNTYIFNGSRQCKACNANRKRTAYHLTREKQ